MHLLKKKSGKCRYFEKKLNELCTENFLQYFQLRKNYILYKILFDMSNVME